MNKHFVDFALILIFFIAYFITKDFFLATLVLLAAASIQIVISRVFFGKVEPMQLALFGVLAVAALLTLVFKDERFLKWKPTVINWVFSAVLLISYYVFKKNWVKTVLEAAVKSNDDIRFDSEDIPWQKINTIAGLFFIAVGAINLWVAYSFKTEVWVQFRLFGLMGLNFLGVIALMATLFPHLEANIDKDQQPLAAPPNEEAANQPQDNAP